MLQATQRYLKAAVQEEEDLATWQVLSKVPMDNGQTPKGKSAMMLREEGKVSEESTEAGVNECFTPLSVFSDLKMSHLLKK